MDDQTELMQSGLAAGQLSLPAQADMPSSLDASDGGLANLTPDELGQAIQNELSSVNQEALAPALRDISTANNDGGGDMTDGLSAEAGGGVGMSLHPDDISNALPSDIDMLSAENSNVNHEQGLSQSQDLVQTTAAPAASNVSESAATAAAAASTVQSSEGSCPPSTSSAASLPQQPPPPDNMILDPINGMINPKTDEEGNLEVKLEPGSEELLNSFAAESGLKGEEDYGGAFEAVPKKASKKKLGDFHCTEPDCDYYTTRNDKLKMHIKTKHEGLRFNCDVCDFSAMRPDKLREHKKRKHGLETIYECDSCDFVTENYRKFQAHKKDHPENTGDKQIHGCEYCSYTTHRPFRLREHIERKHQNGAYPCEICGYIAPTKHSLLKHKENKHNEVRFPCDECDYQAKRPEHLMNHKKRMHEKDDFEEIADDTIGDDLESNMAEIDPSFWLFQQGIKSESAEEIEKEIKYEPLHFLARQGAIQEEFKDEFKTDPNFKPPKAPAMKKGKKGGSADRKKRKLGNYTCEMCAYVTPRSDKLRMHVRTVHEGLRFPCDMCPYEATRPDKLKLHRERKHINPTPRKPRVVKIKKPRKTKYEEGQEHFCDKCDYKSDKIKNLQAHMVRVHSDQMYHCDQCEYVGSFKLNLKHHQERMHSGKIIMCDKCNYTTRDANRLRYHNQSKHEENRYPCELCEYVSPIHCELKRHYRRKHGTEKYPCDLCDYVGKRPDHLSDHKKRIHLPKTGVVASKTSPDKKPALEQLNRSMDMLHHQTNDASSSVDYSRAHASPFDQKPVLLDQSANALFANKGLGGYPSYGQVLSGHHFLLDHLSRSEQGNAAAAAGSGGGTATADQRQPTDLVQRTSEANNAHMARIEQSARDFYMNKTDLLSQRADSVIVREDPGLARASPRMNHGVTHDLSMPRAAAAATDHMRREEAATVAHRLDHKHGMPDPSVYGHLLSRGMVQGNAEHAAKFELARRMEAAKVEPSDDQLTRLTQAASDPRIYQEVHFIQ